VSRVPHISSPDIPPQIFTVGYGNRSPAQIFDLLKSNSCGYLIDVRSAPYSSYHKEYNRETLERNCQDYGLKYLFMGDQLGGKPKSDEFDDLGRADYTKMAAQPRFQAGMDRLIKAKTMGIPVALLCAELRPETCHRTRLIGISLAERGIELVHIDEAGKLLSQSDALLRLDDGQEDLFS